MKRIQIVDSHTGGEPTRVVIAGGPTMVAGAARGGAPEEVSPAEGSPGRVGQGRVELGSVVPGLSPLARFRDELALHHDTFRRGVICEPRGSEVLVGALLVPPSDPSCVAGVVFFNNVGYLGMCGHGLIGTVVTLGFLGRLGPGVHRLETPVGIVTATYDGRHRVAVENVASYRTQRQVRVTPPGHPPVMGDVAWGGNWFFLVSDHGQELVASRTRELVDYTLRIRQGLEAAGITGEGGAIIDHIELFGPARSPLADSQNFVLCPGGAYDRSPCGTGTSAKLACLMDDGVVGEGEVWRQESIVGSIFEAQGRIVDGRILPTITGHAYVTSTAELIFDPDDPFPAGIA